MSTKRRSELINFLGPFATQISPLGDADLSYMRHAMAEIVPEWTVELEGISSDDTALVVVPEDGEDATGPSFVISRETFGLRVNQVRWDVVTEVGVFASLTDVVTALQVRLVSCLDVAAPASVTLH